MTKSELADLIFSFLGGTCGDYDWDDVISYRQDDPEVEKWRQILNQFDTQYPSKNYNEFCNAEGREKMMKIAVMLKGEPTPEQCIQANAICPPKLD